MTGDIGLAEVAASAALVVLAIVVSVSWRLALHRSLVEAALRAAVQLVVVGWALVLVLDPGSPLVWSWLWVGAMVVFAAGVVRRRAPGAPRVYGTALAAFTASAAVCLGVLFGFGVFPVAARTVVPLGGMAVGNAMTAAVLVARRMVEDVGDQRGAIEAALALGLPPRTAVRPVVVRALRTALTPQIETTRAVGIVFLPGAMTGLILAGVDPLDAVLVQVVVMYLVLGSVATTTAVVALLVQRQLFTRDWRLLPPAGAPSPRRTGARRSTRS